MDIKRMTEVEMDNAANALIDWFKSQDIKPSDGSIIMLRLISTQLVGKTTNLVELEKAINNLVTILTCDVVLELKSKLGS